jgi:outer membrane protein
LKRAVAICLALVAGATQAQTAEPQQVTKLTFHDAMERAVRVNNTVERARADVGIAEANRQQLLSNVLPRITATGTTQRNSESVSFTNGGSSTTVLAKNDWNYRLTMSQPVFAGRRELRAYSQAKIAVQNAQIGVGGTEDAVLLRVASNYLAVVNADSRIAIEQRNVEIAQKRRAQATAFYQAGESTKVDVLRAETAIKASQRLLAVAQQARQDAISRLRADLDLDGDIQVVNPDHPLPPLPDESALITRAEASRPDVDIAENNVQVARLEVQKQRGFWLPTVTFNGGFINQKSQFPAPHYAFGALNFNVPILQSGEVQARVAAARERELQSKLDLESTKVDVREDVRTAFTALREAATSLGLAKEQLAAAEAEYNQVFELYRAQEATSLDVASSEASLAEARRAVNEESLNRDLAELRVWYASGAIKQAVNVTSGAVQQ